jgi:hypothetical protein
MNCVKLPVTFIFLLAFCGSCLNPFAPSLSDEKTNKNQILTNQTSPEDVLINFSYAYNFKDSLVYSDLLDSTFIFISRNFATNPVTSINWGRDVDIQTTVRLFRHFETVDLIWGGTVFLNFFNDSTEAEIKKTFQLTLDGGEEIPTLNGEALFYMRKQIINSEPFWRITRWEDLSTF